MSTFSSSVWTSVDATTVAKSSVQRTHPRGDEQPAKDAA